MDPRGAEKPRRTLASETRAREEVHLTRPPDHPEGSGHVMAASRDAMMAWYRNKIPTFNELNYLESAFCNCNIHIVEITVQIS